MKTLPVVFLLAVTPALLLAQNDTTKTTRPRPAAETPNTPPADALLLNNQLGNTSTSTQIRLVDNRYEGLRGTPYLVPTWSKGEIELVTGRVYADVPLKFDALTQNLVILRPAQKDSILVYANQIKRFSFQDTDGNPFVYRRFPAVKTDDAELKESYFQVLYTGKNTLLKRTGKTLRKADFKQAYSSNVRYDAYEDNVTYYLLRPDQNLVKLKRARKSLFETLGGDQNALKAFADREKLSFKTDVDMAKLIQFADGL
ncbi:MAG: hypothetical protein H7Z72_06530 [Bacteroidetes bacterium]|nr:hypothetical protein [Fibrella sp.]